jgi:hypothetical protein
VFSEDGSCREAVRKFLAWQVLDNNKTASPNTAAYCKARARLQQKNLDDIQLQVAQRIESASPKENLWYGRRVRVVDSSSVSMPDSPSNQKEYPQPKGQKHGCGFPAMRLVAMFSLATGIILGLTKGALTIAERTLFRTLWSLLEPGDVVLSDRGFCSFAEFFYLIQLGVDCAIRKHQRLTKSLSRQKRLRKGDHLVRWQKTSKRPDWIDQKTWDDMPDFLIVREISYSVDIPGFRTETVTVLTTLLDPIAFPKKAFVQLYRQRWMVELFLRHIKTTMGMDILQCKTPQMVHKELCMYVIAYNLIRALMLEASTRHNCQISRISFKGTLVTVRQWAPVMTVATPVTLERLTNLLLGYIAKDLLPRRPNRVEPRARKRRPKNFPLLNKPRKLFKEIQHRNHYVKNLS